MLYAHGGRKKEENGKFEGEGEGEESSKTSVIRKVSERDLGRSLSGGLNKFSTYIFKVSQLNSKTTLLIKVKTI